MTFVSNPKAAFRHYRPAAQEIREIPHRSTVFHDDRSVELN